MSSKFHIESVLSALRSVLPADDAPISLHEPRFSGNEWSYVKECLDIGWVSSAGRFVDRFEEELARYTGMKRAVAVVNGTAALHTCLKLVGVREGDEVIVPALTFVATANAVIYCNATPHFVDCEERTLGLDPAKLLRYLDQIAEVGASGCFNRVTGRRIRAVVPMHTFGHPVDLDPLVEVCRRFRLEVVEDAAESLGSYYKGKHTGAFGRFAALSFNGNKIITTGGGGAILTDDDDLGKLAKHLTTTARVIHQWEISHDMSGFNYRLPNINAALGCAQLEALPGILSKKRALAEIYRKAFEGVAGVTFVTETEFARSNYWLNVLLLDEEIADQRDALLERTNAEGIMTRPTWVLMHHLPMFKDCPRMDLSVSESLERRLVTLPSSFFLGDAYVKA